MPREVFYAVRALGVWHEHVEATVGGSEAGDAAGRAIRIDRVDLAGCAVAVDEAHGDERLRGVELLFVFELREAFAVCDHDWQARFLHAFEEY